MDVDEHLQIVVVTPDRYYHCKPIEPFFKIPFIYTDRTDWVEIEKMNPSVLIFLADWTTDYVALIEQARKNFIPTILLMDGLIDWKGFVGSTKWLAGNNILPYHPVYCDKVFAPGFRTARTLLSWGNSSSKIEVTGLPRFDEYNAIPTQKKKIEKIRKTVLILSANTPGHTDEQVKLSQQLFVDLHEELSKQPDLEVVWRIRKGFDKLIPTSISNSTAGDLKDYLIKADLVITQPSSVVAEAMYADVPVVIADYGLFPDYYQSAWRISCREQILPVIQDMLYPKPEKVLFQNELKTDLLNHVGNASETCAHIIIELVREAEQMKRTKGNSTYSPFISKKYPAPSVAKMNPFYFEFTPEPIISEIT